MYFQNYTKSYLTLSQTTNFRLFQTEKVADNTFKIDKKGRKFFKRVENALGIGETLFPTMFSKEFYCRHVKKGLFGKGLSDRFFFCIYDIFLQKGTFSPDEHFVL